MADADVFGKRYGEVLLVRMGAHGPEATVYNTFNVRRHLISASTHWASRESATDTWRSAVAEA